MILLPRPISEFSPLRFSFCGNSTMKKLFDVFRIANEGKGLLCNFVPRRGVRYQDNVKWVKPEKKIFYDPARTGDLVPFPQLKLDSVFYEFKDSKELQNADENVKKTFSLGYQIPKKWLESYENDLVQKVKRHALDNNSPEVKIAKLTAKIRFYQSVVTGKQKKCGLLKKIVKEQIDVRKKKLKLLRAEDYKRFEWLLQQLDLEFRPPVAVGENRRTRKKSLMLLAKLKVEQAKEKKLAEYKKTLDSQKVPFLEKKIMKLKEIKEKEEQYKLPPTVTDEDIQECIEKLEQVKIEIAEREKRGYARKIHPYFLEPYEENLLWEKEKAAEVIREKLELERQKKAGETSVL